MKCTRAKYCGTCQELDVSFHPLYVHDFNERTLSKGMEIVKQPCVVPNVQEYGFPNLFSQLSFILIILCMM